MFKSNKPLTSTDTLIGQGTQVEGKLFCDSGIRIEGEFRGDIHCKGSVVIGECGLAKSNITAMEITIAGRVFGDIFTSGRLIITSSGHLTGNVAAHAIIIHDGGQFNGSSTMDTSYEILPQEGSKLQDDKESEPYAV